MSTDLMETDVSPATETPHEDTPDAIVAIMIEGIHTFLTRPVDDESMMRAQHVLLRTNLYPEASERRREELDELRRTVWLKVARGLVARVEDKEQPLWLRAVLHADFAVLQAKECGADASPEEAKLRVLLDGREPAEVCRATWPNEISTSRRPRRI